MNLTAQLKKYIKSLHLHKYRQKYNKFIAEGPKICAEFLAEKKYSPEYIVCSADWLQDNAHLVIGNENRVMTCTDKDLKSISSLQNPNKILIVFKSLETAPSLDIEHEWALYLDTIQDPGNMGTILRIADWYNIPYVLASLDSVNFYHPKVIQAGMGAHNRVDLLSIDFALLKALNLNTIALTLGGADIESVNLESGLIIIGNESKGVKPSIVDQSQWQLTIKRKGGAESLNAAVACGIACQILTK